MAFWQFFPLFQTAYVTENSLEDRNCQDRICKEALFMDIDKPFQTNLALYKQLIPDTT